MVVLWEPHARWRTSVSSSELVCGLDLDQVVDFFILVVEAWLRHAGGFDVVVLEAISHEVDVDEVMKITRKRGLSRLPGQMGCRRSQEEYGGHE